MLSCEKQYNQEDLVIITKSNEQPLYFWLASHDNVLYNHAW